MVESALQILNTLPISDYLPLMPAVVLGILCIVLALKGTKWKQRYRELSATTTLLEERLHLEQELHRDRTTLIEAASSELKLQFRDLAHQIFEEKSKTFSNQHDQRIDMLLRPFREQIDSFKNRVETIFVEETGQRSSLKQEIILLRDLNQRINEEARNLTRAISGDRQVQGAWGELVLEKLLERSGLRKGQEYDAQKGLRDQENRLFKPDVVIHLPEHKDIIIDSKVSLSAWSRYVAADDPEARSKAMKEHLLALNNHIKSLSTKDYSSLKGVHSLDFVLMFVPIDAAFIEASQVDQSLIDQMYSSRIIIVTPTTLLATLKIIEHIWQLERQSRNALEIANRASSLYDKLRGFLEDMDKLGKQLDTSRDSFDRAMNKLARGRGNLVSQARQFPELGIQVKKEIDNELLQHGSEE